MIVAVVVWEMVENVPTCN